VDYRTGSALGAEVADEAYGCILRSRLQESQAARSLTIQPITLLSCLRRRKSCREKRRRFIMYASLYNLTQRKVDYIYDDIVALSELEEF
jgi:hypothetical protein